MSHDDYGREPCPWRILEDCGGAFSMGLIGGSLFQSIIGFRNAPSGINRRFIGSLTAIKTRSPMIAGGFAVWGVTYSSIDCTLAHLRKKEDPWNSIISAALAGSILSARNGIGPMTTSAVFGGVVIGLIEFINIFVTRMSADQFKPQPLNFEQPPEGWQS